LHEMTRLQVQTAVWSSLHEPVRISRLSHGLVFESLVYWVHDEHEFGSGLGLLLLGLGLTSGFEIAATRNQHTLRRRSTEIQEGRY